MPEIVFDATFDRGRGGSRSPASVHLCPACQSGLYPSAERIISDDFVKLVVMGQCVRAWPHQTHVAVQHVEQLRQLIDARPAQPFAYARHSFIGKPSLNYRGTVL